MGMFTVGETLRYGDGTTALNTPISKDVETLQKRLQQLKYMSTISSYGYFGLPTEESVNAYKFKVIPAGNYGSNYGVDGTTTWVSLGLPFESLIPPITPQPKPNQKPPIPAPNPIPLPSVAPIPNPTPTPVIQSQTGYPITIPAAFGESIIGKGYYTPITCNEILNPYLPPPLSDAQINAAIPNNISSQRKNILKIALKEVGKIPYFYGGKPYMHPDSEWNKMWYKVSSGATAGQLQPWGLDCSGFVEWVYTHAFNGKNPFTKGDSDLNETC